APVAISTRPAAWQKTPHPAGNEASVPQFPTAVTPLVSHPSPFSADCVSASPPTKVSVGQTGVDRARLIAPADRSGRKQHAQLVVPGAASPARAIQGEQAVRYAGASPGGSSASGAPPRNPQRSGLEMSAPY